MPGDRSGTGPTPVRSGPALVGDALVGAALVGAAPVAGSTAVPVVVLAGKPGVGKTALAVHVAHSLAARFPDGQLYADLRGAGPDPVTADAVLHRFLRALGMDAAAVPADRVQEAAARLDEALAVWPREDRRDPVRMHRLIDRLRAPGQAGGGAEVG